MNRRELILNCLVAPGAIAPMWATIAGVFTPGVDVFSELERAD
jgi:hypothetical protein